MRKIKAAVQGDNVVLVLPVDILVYACEHNPQTHMMVRDRTRFAKWIADNIVEHDEDEAGDSALFRLLDDMFEAAAADGVIDVEDGDSDA